MPKKLTKEDFIRKAIEIHGNKYDYSKVEYINNSTKVCIICPEHNKFWQTPHNHLKGKGCPKCNGGVQDDRETFIIKARNVHGNKYDYSKVEYVNSQTKVCIICPEHGEFWQKPNGHLNGKGCSKCNDFVTDSKSFIQKAEQIHNYKYDYSKVVYTKSIIPVCIICPEHGEFWQRPSQHLQGKGCSYCANKSNGDRCRSDTEDFIQKAIKAHGDKYDYSKVEYVDSQTKVCIICPEHGEFWQTPNSHLSGCGCIPCGVKSRIKKKTKTLEKFISDANKIHGLKYDYNNTIYENCKKPVIIVCPIHGEFLQTPDSHLGGQGCPKCGNIMSKAEDDIMELLQPCNPQRHNRILLKGKEIDIYLRGLKLGIEYNGLHWHSELYGKDCRYHLDKLNECNKQDIHLIQIFEDEWMNHKDICISKLKQICGLNTNLKIYARKCIIREIKNKHKAYEFLDKNHIQGQTGCTLALGAYYGEQLVAVMCFKKEKEGFWDLNRFASDINYQCIGLGGKLFKYFTDNYPYQEVKSFADRRWTTDLTDNLYTKLGFEFDSYVEPTYWYYNPAVERYKRFHKFGFRKQILHKQYDLPLTMTEREMTTALGYTRIWDCGLLKYVYKNFEK